MLRISMAIVLLGCQGQTPHQASCGGASVGLCDPYQHTQVTAASLTPSGLAVADFGATAHIRVQIDPCSMAPQPPTVQLDALVPGGADAGTDVSVMSLLMLTDG